MFVIGICLFYFYSDKKEIVMFNLVPAWAKHYEEFWLTIRRRNLWSVSYTHLDVYKRQAKVTVPERNSVYDF